jgi:uncharacterized membrane protein
MLFSFDPTVKATIAFLRRLHVKVTSSTVNETLQNHPDWPSLLSISDAMNKWHVPNGAGKIVPENIDDLPVPFIAATRRATPFVIITAVTDNNIYTLSNNYRKEVKESKSDFIKEWYGVYIIAEPTEHSGEPDYKATKRKEIIASLIPLTAFIVLAFATTYFFLANSRTGIAESFFPATGILLQYAITLAGLLVTSLLLWYEIDKNNPLLNKVCTGIAKGNCTAILTGKAAKVFGSLSWSEVGFFYYAGALLCLVFAGENIFPYVSLIALFNILAAPYPVFSLYYQWRVAKQWCVLCLAVQALLIAGLVNVLSNQLYSPIEEITLPVIVQGFLLYSLPLLIWFTIKPFILKLQEAKNTKRDYIRTKFNTEIFETLLRNQKPIKVIPDSLGINLGDPDAKNTLIKVCSPYCPPCSRAHPDIEKLLEETADVKVKIIFTAMHNDDERKPARHLLAIAEMNDETALKLALDDWYLPAKKDYEAFAGKYPVNGKLQLQNTKIEAMRQWCDEIKIDHTPTFFINGYQLPQTYTITDLRYFLLE